MDTTPELVAMDGIIGRMRSYMIQMSAEKAHAQSLIKTQLDISYILCRAIDVDEALSQCVERIVHNTPYDSSAIYMMDRDGAYNIELEYKIPPHLLGVFPHFAPDSDAARFTAIGDSYFGSYATFMTMIGQPSDPLKDVHRQLALLPMNSHRGTEGALVMLAEGEFVCEDILKDALASIASNMASSVAKIRTMYALRESSVQLKLMSDHATDGIAIINSGNIVRANHTLAGLIGIEAERLRGARVDKFMIEPATGAGMLLDITGAPREGTASKLYRLNRVNGYEDCAVWVVRVAPSER